MARGMKRSGWVRRAGAASAEARTISRTRPARPLVLGMVAAPLILVLSGPAQAQAPAAQASGDAAPPSFTLPASSGAPSKAGASACVGAERPCVMVPPPRPKDPLAERDSARKAYESPAYAAKSKANRHGMGEILSVTELQSCFAGISSDVVAARDSRDPLVKMTTDRFTGPLPPAGDGKVIDLITRKYDAHGNLVYRERSSAAAQWKPHIVTCGYDQRGNLTTRTDNLFGTLEGFTASIGQAGLVDVERFTYDSEPDGVVDHRRTVSYAYDEKGRRLSRTDVLDLGADGVPDYLGREWVGYDGTGLRSLVVLEQDYDADGAWDWRQTDFAVRDGQGRLDRFGVEWDYDADGVADHRLQTTDTYDSQGVFIREVYESDSQADGIPEYRSVTDFTYNKKGQVVRDEVSVYWEHPFDSPEDTDTRLWHYDNKGQLVRQVFTADHFVDGVIDVTMTVDYVNDQHGNVVEYLSAFTLADWPTSYRHETTKLDVRGNILEVVLTTYAEGQQASAQGWRDRFQYDPPGK